MAPDQDDLEPDLRIGLLQCGHLPPQLIEEHGDYPEVFADLLGPFGIRLRTWQVTEGDLPISTTECDGWLVSGSADSAYDDLPWIPPVEQLLRDIVAEDYRRVMAGEVEYATLTVLD